MEYYQQLQTYFKGLGYSPEATEYYSQAAYYQAMQQAQAAQQPANDQQLLIQQFMSLNDGQKMQFAQNWLLKNPQFFKKEEPPKPPTPPPTETKPDADKDTDTDKTTEDDKTDKTEKDDKTKDTDKEDKTTEKEKPKFPVISGEGKIEGVEFDSGDGENYELKVTKGSVYNLLSDKGLGINGKYGTQGESEKLILTEAAISFGGSIITMDNQGDLKIDSKDFKADKNDMDGEIVKKGSKYVISAGDYEVTVSASVSGGVKFAITGTDIKKDGVAPEGLWGVTFDGDKETKKEIVSSIAVKDYKITSVKKFDFSNNNNIDAGEADSTEKKKKTISEDEQNLSLWQEENPTMATVLGKIGGGTFQYFGGDMANTADDASWDMTKLNNSSIYNLFSDENLQVGAKFNTTGDGKNYPRELGFLADGRVIKVNRNSSADNKLSVSVDGTTLAAGSSSGKATMNADGTSLTISATVNGELWSFTVNADTANAEGLSMDISGTGVGKNEVRTSGLWGAFLGSGFIGDAGANDTNGAGFIRDSDGARTWFDHDDMAGALESYQLSGYDTEDEGYSVYAGY